MTLLYVVIAAWAATSPAGTVVALTDELDRYLGSACVVGHLNGRTYLLTAEHVASAGASHCFEGPLRLERLSEDPDLALLSVPAVFGRPFELGSSADVGDRVRLSGHLWAQPLSTWGRISNAELGWIDSSVHPGMSGGPVTDEDGRLVGMTIAGMGPGTITVYVPVDNLRWILEEVLP